VRILEIIISKHSEEEFDKILSHGKIIERWQYKSDNEQITYKVLIQDDDAKELLQRLEKRSIHRVVIYPVEGTLPKLEEPVDHSGKKIKIGKFITLSKEELYHDIDKPVSLSVNYILMIILSSFVAGIGILKNNVAIIIGAMVIAPFLGPNMSLAFGTTLGDIPIIKKSILTALVGTIIALVISVLWGLFASNVDNILRDPNIEYQDVLLALVCGFAGVISILSGQGSTLVGVMVAAALLPPLIRSGLLLGGADYNDALNSFLIFSTNIVCLNIAGIITFYLAGIRPRRWWEKEEANKKTRSAFAIWTVALVLLVIAIMLYSKFG
jgi:uncharacterized hydrophobic protein (TIGR00341 family)